MPEPTNPNARRPWESRLSDAAARIEQELRGVVKTVDEEVVPEVRRHSSAALHRLAERMQALAESLDDARRRHGPDVPPPPPPGPSSKP